MADDDNNNEMKRYSHLLSAHEKLIEHSNRNFSTL